MIQWIAKNLPRDAYVTIMSQYTPAYKARHSPEIGRRITHQEYREALHYAEEAGLSPIDMQGYPFKENQRLT